MATTSLNYSAPASITCTLTSLADAGWRESAVVDNTTDKYVDALVTLSVQVGTVTAQGSIRVYAYGSIDGGTVYSAGLIGTDETITWGTTPSTSSVDGYNQLVSVGMAWVDGTDDDNDIEFGPFSIASAFGGVLPPKWGLVIFNDTGVALHATGTNNSIDYIGVKVDVA